MDESGRRSRNNANPNKLGKISSKFTATLENGIRRSGTLIFYHSSCFVLLPAIFAIIMTILIFTSAPFPMPGSVQTVSVKEMFVSSDEQAAKIRQFEQAWFGDTWYILGSGRQNGKLLIKTSHDALSDGLLNEVIILHKSITKIRYPDPHLRKDILFKDVCKKSFDFASGYSNNSPCIIDPLMEMLICSSSTDSLIFKVEIDSNTGALWGTLQPTSLAGESSLNSSLSHCNLKQKRIFVGESIGLVDENMINVAASLGAIRINYILQDTEGHKTRSRLWLQEFDEKVATYQSGHLSQTSFTTETLNVQWLDLVNLTLYHGLTLCSIDFLMLVLFSSSLHKTVFGVYIALCGSLSLGMTLTSVYTLHFLVYEIPTFNFPLCAILTTVLQGIFQLVYLNQYLTTRKDDRQTNCEECFVESYEHSISTNLFYWSLFTVCFASMAFPQSLLSFQNMCATCCIGFTLVLFYQATFFPACVKIYERWLQRRVEGSCCGSITRQVNRGSRFSDSLDQEEGTSASKEDENRRKSETTWLQKFKKMISKRLDGYLEHIVSDYMRAIGGLMYLTYIACCYVGCLHFTERISPVQLISMNHESFKYFEDVEEAFQPFGPKIVVYGSFNGKPWDKDALQELFLIHQRLLQVDAIDDALSYNWFRSYFNYTTSAEVEEIEEESNAGVDYNLKEYFNSVEQEQPDDALANDPFSYKFKGFENYWEKHDWESAWKNFTQTEMFTKNYRRDIIMTSSETSHHHVDAMPTTVGHFRWFYQTSKSDYPGKREALISSFQEISDRIDKTIVTSLYFDSPELDWWKSINAGAFQNPLICLLMFSLIVVMISLTFSQSILVVFWCAFVCVSVSFGVCGILSFFSFGRDSFTLPCIIFSLPFSVVINGEMLRVFSDGLEGGRAYWAKKAVKNAAPQTIIYTLFLMTVNLVLCFRQSYAYRAPLITLMCLCIVLILHTFVFMPVLLTVFPPSKKATRSFPGNAPAKSGGSESDEICAVTDSRPHLHARRFFYDSQRAASFRSEDDETKMEHITCL